MKTHLGRSICMSCLMLCFIAPLSHARETDRGTVIYEQEGLLVTVYGWTERPGRKLADFCSGSGKSISYRSAYNVSVTYNVPHKERTKLITPSYTEFVKEKIYPNLFKTCGGINITEINMSMSKIGEYTTQDWRETMTFAIADNGRSVTQTNYYPNPIAKANMSIEEIEALMPSETGSVSVPTQRSGKELYNDGKVTIFAREDIWCRPKNRSKGRPNANTGLDIIVPVSYSELKNWLRTHYGNFDYKIIKPLIDEACLPSSSVNAKFYQDGQSAHLEKVIYGWEKPRVRGGLIDPFATEKFAVLSRVAGQTRDARLAAIKKQKTELDVWDMPCQGNFCVLPGGAYFQAIHDGDHSALKRMDGIVDKAISRWLRRTLGESVASKKDQEYSLLPVIADTYFYNYQKGFMLRCSDDLMQKTYSYKNPTFEMPDYGDFAMPDMGGEIDYATYVVPRKFLPLCDKICDAFGGAQDRLPIESLNIKPAHATINSVYLISGKFRCNQKEIKRFESNLIKLTETYLKNKESWLNTSSSQATHNQVKPKAVISLSTQPVQGTQRERLTPSIQPSATNTSGTSGANTAPETFQTQTIPTAPAQGKREIRMHEADRYERMNAEISALSEMYTARLNNLSQEFKKNMTNVSDVARRAEMMKSFQAKMAELSAEAARETQKVKDKYKNNQAEK